MYVCVPAPLAKAWAQDYSHRCYFCFNPSMDNLLVEKKKPSPSEPIINGQQLPKWGCVERTSRTASHPCKGLIDPLSWRSYASHSYCELTGMIVILRPFFLHFVLVCIFFPDPSFKNWCLPSLGGCETYVPFRAEGLTVTYFEYQDLFSVYAVTAVCCQKMLLWQRSRETLIYEYNPKYFKAIWWSYLHWPRQQL